jgi:hypothetical protein
MLFGAKGALTPAGERPRETLAGALALKKAPEPSRGKRVPLADINSQF